MATRLTRAVVREVATKRGPRIVTITQHGVTMRAKRKQHSVGPVSWGWIEDKGAAVAAEFDSAPRRRKSR